MPTKQRQTEANGIMMRRCYNNGVSCGEKMAADESIKNFGEFPMRGSRCVTYQGTQDGAKKFFMPAPFTKSDFCMNGAGRCSYR